MHSGPSKFAEAVAAIFIPPACREEVLGDLHERYRSPGHYGFDALRTIPLVILSRIRRTTDPRVLLMQVFAWYLSFLVAARMNDAAVLIEGWGLLRLAVPAAMATLGLILEDVYAKPGRRPPLSLARGPVVALGLAVISQVILRIGSAELAVPLWITLYGCGMSFLMSSAIRLLFPPGGDQLQGVNVPADWLKQAGASAENWQRGSRVVRVAALLLLLLFVLLSEMSRK